MKVTCAKSRDLVAQFQGEESIAVTAKSVLAMVRSTTEAMDISTPSPVERKVISTPGMARK